MWEDNRTFKVIYAYLKILSIDLSKMRIKRLLNTPVGNTMRGMSDTLDALHVNNNVYQLPKNYLNRLQAPFIASIQSNNSPFCLVEEIKGEQIILTDNKKKHLGIPWELFLQKWDGTILVAEKTNETVIDNKPIIYDFFVKLLYSLPFFLPLLLAFIPFVYGTVDISYGLHLLFLIIGLYFSCAIISEESYNPRFLEKFCKVGRIVDCNKVLHSKGSKLFGIKMGDFSFLFFATLYFYAIVYGVPSLRISFILMLPAIAFALYSVIYQIFILRRFCLFCLCIDLLIGGDMLLLSISKYEAYLTIYGRDVFLFFIIGCFVFIGWRQITMLLAQNFKGKQLQSRFVMLYRPNIFQRLLEQETKVEGINKQWTIYNENIKSGNEVIIISNLNCSNCKKIYHHLQKLSSLTKIKLIFMANSADKQDVCLSLQLLSYYKLKGWNDTIKALDRWDNNEDTKIIQRQAVNTMGRELFENQQTYCRENRFIYTPIIIVNEHLLPDVYNIEDLEYLL